MSVNSIWTRSKRQRDGHNEVNAGDRQILLVLTLQGARGDVTSNTEEVKLMGKNISSPDCTVIKMRKIR